jgi:hypothetical protein
MTTYLLDANIFIQAKNLHSHQLEYTVVTHEVVAQSAKRIKIPNACLGLSVRYVTPFTMLRGEKARFILPQPPALRAALSRRVGLGPPHAGFSWILPDGCRP